MIPETEKMSDKRSFHCEASEHQTIFKLETRIFDFLWGDSLAAWRICNGRGSSGDVHQRGSADQPDDSLNGHHATPK
jgi:hypothetical protein